MICSHCTGRHHSMACPQLRRTLIELGVRPWPETKEPKARS